MIDRLKKELEKADFEAQNAKNLFLLTQSSEDAAEFNFRAGVYSGLKKALKIVAQ